MVRFIYTTIDIVDEGVEGGGSIDTVPLMSFINYCLEAAKISGDYIPRFQPLSKYAACDAGVECISGKSFSILALEKWSGGHPQRSLE